MGFLVKAAGGLLGMGIGALFGKKRKQQVVQPRIATRDDAALEAEREEELARRRGASADRIVGASGEPAGGLGRLIVGS
jgi:hypothetical protein